MTRTTRRRAGLNGLGIALALASLPGSAGWAASDPLLVVVEAPPALAAESADIRGAIGAELHASPVAPIKSTTNDPPQRLLIVALDSARITMSFRSNDAAPVVRAIPAPADHAARLRAIAWLAGNLARDQVGDTMALADLDDAAPAASPPTAPEPAKPSIEPPKFTPVVPTVVARSDPRPSGESGWTVGASVGPAMNLYSTGHALSQSLFGSWNLRNSLGDVWELDSGTIWRVDARHRTEGSGLFEGVALEGSSQFVGAGIVGAMGLAGWALQRGKWSLEAGGGVGIDLIRTQRISGVATQTAGAASVDVVYDSSLRPGLYLTGTIALSRQIFGPMRLVWSFDTHVSVIDKYDGYLASTLGVRYHL